MISKSFSPTSMDSDEDDSDAYIKLAKKTKPTTQASMADFLEKKPAASKAAAKPASKTTARKARGGPLCCARRTCHVPAMGSRPSLACLGGNVVQGLLSWDMCIEWSEAPSRPHPAPLSDLNRPPLPAHHYSIPNPQQLPAHPATPSPRPPQIRGSTRAAHVTVAPRRPPP